MELFFAPPPADGIIALPEEESAHCVKVLRHRPGDTIHVIDGEGTLYTCRLTEASSKAAVAQVLSADSRWGGHPYRLTLGVCPTKNNDRYEWFIEKATEIGVDEIVPLIGERSERKVWKTDRGKKLALSAAKQSLKAAVPLIREPMSVNAFLKEASSSLRLICYCFEEDDAPRQSIAAVLRAHGASDITILIGPEGDFSPEEARAALGCGFIPVHLGPSRLRTETAAVTAAESVYFHFCL